MATTALKSRAPSRCVTRPLSCGPAANADDFVVRLDAACPAIVGVFEADQPCANEMIIVAADEAHKLLEPEDAVLAFDRPDGQAAELGVGPLLVLVECGSRFRR